jgi:hypothetical protein
MYINARQTDIYDFAVSLYILRRYIFTSIIISQTKETDDNTIKQIKASVLIVPLGIRRLVVVITVSSVA